MAGYVVCPRCGAGIGQARIGESERVRCECCGSTYSGKGYCFGREYPPSGQ